MIERIAGCLGQGGRSLLHGLKKKNLLRSQRFLHSTFWSHGAGAINLPAWWILLLQNPIPDHDRFSKTREPSAATAMVSGLQEILLGLLYPVQTRALISRLKRSTNAHYQAAQSLKKCSRNYTSIATDLISASGEVQKEAEVDADINGEQNGAQKRRRIHELLGAEHSKKSCDALWQAYQDLLELSEILSPQELLRMLRCLRVSESSPDAERLLALFESIPVDERRAIYYSYAIEAALKLNDADTALYIHQEALRRLHSPVGASAILRHAITHHNWRLAIATWHVFWSTGFVYYTRNNIWAGIDGLPLSTQMEKALAAAKFAVSQLESPESEDPSAARDFSLELIKRSFQFKGIIFDINVWKLLLEQVRGFREHDAGLRTTALEILAIEQALSIANEVYGGEAVDHYCELRQRDATLVPSKKLLKSLLNQVNIRNSSKIMSIVFADWRKHYGKVDASVYVRMMRYWARTGEADHVQNLFHAYCADHGEPQNIIPYNSLLQVYGRRADPEQAARVFNDMRNNRAFLPEVPSYNHVIHAFARVGDVEGALNWFENLREAGMKPDSNSYFALMLMYSKRGDRDAVHDLLQEAIAEEVKPTKAMIDILVLADVNDEKLDEAEKLVEEALNMDIQGSRTDMWNILLNALALRKNLHKVTQLHKRMQEAGVSSNSRTYAALITSLAVTKQPSLAYKVLKTVMPQVGIQPSVLHYAIVMGGFLQTKSYEDLFAVYKDMLEHDLSPTISTQNALLRAAASFGKPSANGEPADKADFTRARQVLDHTIANLDPSELASSEPRKFIGPHRLDEAFTSTYYEYLIFVYGKEGAFQEVSEAYNQYITTSHRFSNRDVGSSPPMRMLSALLVAHKHAGNNEEVDQCWYLALDKSETLARKASAKELSQSNWVLPSRRFIMNLPLQHYLDHMGDQRRFDDMINVVNDLLRSGYDLTHRNWNAYIQYLTRSSTTSHMLLAFTLAESILMPSWPGWETMGKHPAKMKYRFKGMAKDMLKDPAKRAPTYLTFVRLTAAYVELGFGRSNRRRRKEVEELEASGEVKKTLDAVRNLPMIDDWEQRTILSKGS